MSSATEPNTEPADSGLRALTNNHNQTVLR